VIAIFEHLLKRETWFSVGARRVPEDGPAWVIALGSTVLTAYILAVAFGLPVAPWTLAVTFLAAFLALCFLMIGPRATSGVHRLPPSDVILALVAVAVGAYFAIAAARLGNRVALLDPLGPWDKAVASAMLLLVLEAIRRVVGLGLMTLVLAFVAYALLGHHLHGVLGHGRMTYTNLVDVVVFTSDGLLGLPIETAALYAFLFMLFGTVLRFARAGAFFTDLATAIAGRWRGAPAKIAVISSGLCGTVAGSASLDVAATGGINIPSMKRHGYTATMAGAIELTAAAGGSIMPPAMGSAAFVMMAYADIPYRELAAAALLPACLYYIAVYAQVHFQSEKNGTLRLRKEEIPKLRAVAERCAPFAASIVTVVTGLLAGFAPNRVAAFGTLTALAVAALKRRTRFGRLDFLRATADTVLRMLPVAVACAAAGIIIAVIATTGLAPKFAELVYALTGGNSFVALVIAAVLTVFLGMGMPTPAAYILAAVLMSPILQNLGVPDLSAHMFLLYFAAMSSVTPPVAAASYVAAAIARANAFAISVNALRFAIAAFVVPFAFVASTTLLMEGPAWRIALDFVTASVGFVLIAAACEGHPMLGVRWWERLLLAAAGIFFVVPEMWANAVGAALAAVSMASARYGPGLRKISGK
jgi:TRAP transporter 4TM/12TM fusion protein